MHKVPPHSRLPGELSLTPGSTSTTDIAPGMRQHRIFCNSDPIEGFLELNLTFSIWMYWESTSKEIVHGELTPLINKNNESANC